MLFPAGAHGTGKLDWVINMGCQTGQNDIFEPADFF